MDDDHSSIHSQPREYRDIQSLETTIHQDSGSSLVLPSSLPPPSPVTEKDLIQVEDVKLPYYSKQSLVLDFRSVETENEFKLHNLLYTADRFVKLAHLSANGIHSSEGNVTQYYSLIKAAIGCLLVILEKYHQSLSTELQISVYLKLANLYLFETMNINLAEDAVNKAVSLASRTGLIRFKFQAEYLAAQILFRNNPKLGLKYVNNKIDEYNRNLAFGIFSALFELLKLKYTIVVDPNHAFAVIEELSMNSNVDDLTRQLILSYYTSFLLFSKRLPQLQIVLDELEQLISKRTTPQLQGMYLCYRTWWGILKDDTNLTKQNISKMDSFVKKQKSDSWRGWSEDGSFVIHLKIHSADQTDTNDFFEVSYCVDWLSNQDFLFMMYFMAGLAYLPKSFDKKDRSRKFFDACETLISSQLSLLNLRGKSLGLEQHENAILKLRFLKVYINYFVILARFNSGNWTVFPKEDDRELFHFINQYDEGLFSSQELLLYHKLVPHILYILAVYYHSKLDFQMAKYYYSRVGSHMRKSSLDLPPESRFMSDPTILSLHQIGLGIGPDSLEMRGASNELYILSSLNMLTILSFEIKTSTEEEGFLLKSSLRKEILSDLDKCLSKDEDMEFLSDTILNTTIRLFRILYDTTSLSESKEIINAPENIKVISSIMKIPDLMSQITSNYPILAALLFYLSSYCTSDAVVRLKNLQASYHYAKLSKYLKLLCLTSFHIYRLMNENNGGIFSVEEIKDQELKYLDYFDMYKKRYGVQIVSDTEKRESEPGSEAGLYDNEKNDDYYDKTAVDLSVMSTT